MDNYNLSADLGTILAGRRQCRKIFYCDCVEMLKSLSQKEGHCHELVEGHRGADVTQHISHIINPRLGEGIHSGAINGNPDDRNDDGEDPRENRGLPLFTGITELFDSFVVILQGIPGLDETTSREHRQAQLVYHHAVVDNHLDDHSFDRSFIEFSTN